MGLIQRLFGKEENAKEVSVEEITKQDNMAKADLFLRKLAYWTCVSRIANAVTKCEFRTFSQNEEVFGEEYYLWNFEPNKNQNKAEFISKAMNQLYGKNELLIVESNDGQLLVADSFSVKKNELYGNTYSGVVAGDYQFKRTFRSDEVLHWTLNDKNVNQLIHGIYESYCKLIDYAASSFMKSKGDKGVLNISAAAYQDVLFEEKMKKISEEYFKTFFNSSNAVLPLYEGYKYEPIASKTYNTDTSRDLKHQYDDIFDFTARAFNIPPSLAKGDVENTSQAIDEMLTFCIDPLLSMLEQEINRKRNGKKAVLNGTKLHIDSTKVKHIDMFDISGAADKLISSGVYTINMILRAIGESTIDEEWANTHMMTKNYAGIEDVLTEILSDKSKKGGKENEET